MRLGKIIGVWGAVAGLLFWNGVLGIGLLNPLLGRDSGEMMTMFIALTIIVGVSRAFLAKEPQLPWLQVVRISLLWMVLTIVFEVVLGRIAQFAGPARAPRYGMWDGSFWPVIVLAVGSAPVSWLRREGLPLRVTK